MSNWDRRYAERVKLLVQILPVLARESRFALKGGTAINLFQRDLPRLSVDIDLTWLPIDDFRQSIRDMSEALESIGAALSGQPLHLTVQRTGTVANGIHRLVVSRNRARVQIETTPVMRGSVHPVSVMRVRPGVEREFGFAEIQVLDFADLYGGKLVAALSRQHPRDLFDVQPLLQENLLDLRLWRTFLVYLICGAKPVADILTPQVPRDFSQIFELHFRGMTAAPVSAAMLLDVRELLLHRMARMLDVRSRTFLESVEFEAPDFDLIELPLAGELPAIRRKLMNLGQRSKQKRAADQERLRRAFDQLDLIRSR